MEGGDIFLEHRRRVALRIDADEDRRHPRRPRRIALLEPAQRLADDGEVGRADVGAMGEAEIHDPVSAGEIAIGHRPAVLIGQGERAADRRALERRLLGAPEQAASASAEQQAKDRPKAGLGGFRSWRKQALPCYRRADQVETGKRECTTSSAARWRRQWSWRWRRCRPSAQQSYSDSFTFLKAVKERDGDKVTELVSEPGSIVINTPRPRQRRGRAPHRRARPRPQLARLPARQGRPARPPEQSRRHAADPRRPDRLGRRRRAAAGAPGQRRPRQRPRRDRR